MLQISTLRHVRRSPPPKMDCPQRSREHAQRIIANHYTMRRPPEDRNTLPRNATNPCGHLAGIRRPTIRHERPQHMTYARKTSVSIAHTRNEVVETLERYGADGFGYAQEDNLAIVIFSMGGRRFRMDLQLPEPEGFRYTNHSPPRERNEKARQEAYDQACRQRWRALLLVIKAKLEAISAGISTVEAEFLANIVLPDNTTAGDWLLPQIERAYQQGDMPPLLPAAGNEPQRRHPRPIALPPAGKPTNNGGIRKPS